MQRRENEIPFGTSVSDTQVGVTALLGETAEAAPSFLKLLEFVLTAKRK